jgi:hypothetical protein
LSYQWLKDGEEVLGGTQPTLVIADVSDSSFGLYECLVWNNWGHVKSAPAVVADAERRALGKDVL